MPKTKKVYILKLKYYCIILISILLVPFLILNSNSINKKRAQEKELKQDEIFLRKLYSRRLEDQFTSDTNKICEKGSEDLKKYYETGDEKIIEIDDEAIKSENNPEYINALVNLISSEGDIAENIKEYLMHIIPVLIFLVISILFLPGWLVCCICTCTNCCCCCCCKRPSCKIPFYIVTSIIYIFSFVISIYGLSQSNSIFVGLADTECSLLKFIGEVLNGETKETKPKWGGIYGILNIFSETKGKINDLSEQTTLNLGNAKNGAETAKNDFENALEKYSKNVYKDLSITGEEDYKQNLDFLDSSQRGYYVLDIIKQFGEFTATPNPTTTPNSFVDKWYNEEYKKIAENSEKEMSNAYDKFDSLIGMKNKAITGLNNAENSINDIKSSFDDVKSQISDIIIDYSDAIDNYGKLIFKIVYSILMIFVLAIAAIISLQIFTPIFRRGGLNCLFKALIHIFWNLLALLTFFTLLLGSIFILFGTAGKDLIPVVKFLVSDKNLVRDNQDDIILLGRAAEYLTKCINKDGDLKEVINLDIDSMNIIQALRNASNEINSISQEANKLLETKIVYNWYKNNYDNIKTYSVNNFTLVNFDGDQINKVIRFEEDCLSKLNEEVESKNDKWSISCSDENKRDCDNIDISTHTSLYCINPSTCDTHYATNWYANMDEAKLLDAFIKSIQIASKETERLDITTLPETKSIENVLKILDDRYTKFLKGQTSSLGVFNTTINGLTSIFNNFAGEDSNVFSIINCKFIGKNVKVILKYLDKSLGKNFYTVGICLLIVGLAMCFSISFTILLNIIININNNEIFQNENFRGNPMNNGNNNDFAHY